MIIIANKPGQLGNRLIVYSSFIAFCREFNLDLANPAFHDYCDYFQGTAENGLLSFPQKRFNRQNFRFYNLSARFWRKLKADNAWRRSIYLDWHQRMELNEGAVASFSSKKTFVEGWQFRCNDLLAKHKDLIREFFRPIGIYQDQIQDFFSRHNNRFTIGLHIRRGDYKTFEGGRYFYSDIQYKKIIKRILELFPDEKIRMIIASNEKIDLKQFTLPNVIIESCPGHELTDMYCLSNCNLIVGPPSTYTMWASFYGDVPLYMIKDPNKEFSKNDFLVQTEF